MYLLYGGDKLCKTMPDYFSVVGGAATQEVLIDVIAIWHFHDAQNYGYLGYQFDVSCDSPAQHMHPNTLVGGNA